MEAVTRKPIEVHTKYESVKDKCILISGGTTGIGRATANLLGSKGAKLFIFGRHEKELHDALNDIETVGAEVYGMVADQASVEEVRNVFSEAIEKLGKIDILINNAGIGGGSIEEADDWKYIIDTDLCGYIACVKEAIEVMSPYGEGHIINIGSMSADSRRAGSSVYVAAKSAIQGFTESLRKELNSKGIKVSLIEPGWTGTDLIDLPTGKQREMEDAEQLLKAEDIAVCIHYVLTQPKRCDVVTVQLRPHRKSE